MTGPQSIPRARATLPSPPNPGPGSDGLEPTAIAGERALPSLDPLYSPTQIRWGTFFGGPLAATWLLALNFKHLRQPRSMRRAMFIGTLATVAFVGIAWSLPDSFPGFPMGLASLLLAGKIAERVQGARLKRHMEAGGAQASGWKVAGISLGSVASTAACAVAVALFLLRPDMVKFGNSEVYYEGGAVQSEARAVGEALQELEYFNDDNRASVILGRLGPGYRVRFVVREWVFQNAEAQAQFRILGERLSADVFHAKPVEIQLAADYDDVRKVLPWKPL